MRDQLQQRIEQLKAECVSGQRVLAELKSTDPDLMDIIAGQRGDSSAGGGI